MTLSLMEVASANFRTDEESDDLSRKLMEYIGFRARYSAARLAIARSLAINSSPEILAAKDPGKTIKGETLFGSGADLAFWVGLIVERAERGDVTLKEFQSLVGAHWARGVSVLSRVWTDCESDLSKFLQRISTDAGLGLEVKDQDGNSIEFVSDRTSGRIAIPIGDVSTEISSGNKIMFQVNAEGGSPHIAIMGGVGSGKTRTAMAMLRAFRESAPALPVIAFDFKGDLAEDYRLDSMFQATVLSPPDSPIPLDVLTPESTEPVRLEMSAQRFRDALGHLKGQKLGPQQGAAVLSATSSAMRNKSPTTLQDVLSALRTEYRQRNLKPDGALATLEEICRLPLFEADLSPNEFFSRSWIIKLKSDIPEAMRGIVVNLVLGALDSWLNGLPDSSRDGNGNRALRLLLLIDEAHRILDTKLPALANLVRMSRSKGGCIMLISQSPDDFDTESDDFLSEVGVVAALQTNAKPGPTRRLFGAGTDLAGLSKGIGVVRLRGEPSAREVRFW